MANTAVVAYTTTPNADECRYQSASLDIVQEKLQGLVTRVQELQQELQALQLENVHDQAQLQVCARGLRGDRPLTGTRAVCPSNDSIASPRALS